MTNDPFYKQLRESGWRRPLTPDEEASLREWLVAHPDAQADWEAETGLNQALERLPEAPPVSSNFTACVMQAIERERSGEARARNQRPKWQDWHKWLHWLPRAALGAVILGAGLFSFHHMQETRRLELAGSVAAVSQVSSLPSPEILSDFDTIRALSQSPPPDEQLLSLLQ
jgi:hypothetical protein